MAASGALAFDGRGWPWEWPLRWVGLLDPSLFTIVTKTLTRLPRRGNLRWTHPWSVVKRINPSHPPFAKGGKGGFGTGIVNAIGLTNKGIEWWLQQVAPKIPSDYKIIVSIEAESEKETVEMIRMLEGKKIVGIELNLSCPNTPSQDHRTTEKILSLCHSAVGRTRHPLLAKISYTHDYLAIAKQLKGFEAITINSIPWQALFPGRSSPLARFGGGGLSGKMIQPYVWKMVEEISKASNIPVIGPSVWEYEDIQKIFDHGARAVSFGSVFVHHPWRPTLFVRKWRRGHP